MKNGSLPTPTPTITEGNGSSPSKSPEREISLQTRAVGRLTEAEKMEKGSIPWNTYHVYIKAAGGYVLSIIVLLVFMVNIFSTGILFHYRMESQHSWWNFHLALSSWWLSHWLNVGVAVNAKIWMNIMNRKSWIVCLSFHIRMLLG